MVGAAAYMVKVRIKLSQLPTKLKLKLKLSLAKIVFIHYIQTVNKKNVKVPRKKFP